MDETKVIIPGSSVMDGNSVITQVFDRDVDDSRMSGSPGSQKGNISDKTYSPEVINKANNLEKRVLMLTARAEQNQDVLIIDPNTGAIVNEDENSSSSSTVYDQMLGRCKTEDDKNNEQEGNHGYSTVTDVNRIRCEETETKSYGITTRSADNRERSAVVKRGDVDGRESTSCPPADNKDEAKPVLSCSFCPRAFTHVGHLKRHMNMHAPDKQLKCGVCNKIFKRTDKFRIHMRIHTGERPHVCFVCDKRFNRAHHLTRHLLIHVRQGVINIDMVKGKGAIKEIIDDNPLPDFSPPQKSATPATMPQVSDPPEEEDDQVIVTTETVDEGEYSSEGEEGEDRGSVEQQEDDSEVVIILSEDLESQGATSVLSASEKFSQSNMQENTQQGQSPRRKAKPKKIYNCQHCDKIFDRPSRLITHLSNHILEKEKHGGENDDKPEADESGGDDGKELIPGSKPSSFTCEECGKVFPRQDRLNIHLRIHTGEKPYVCQICERRFSRSHHLSRHILTHSGIKNYRCKFCLKWYSTAYYLKEHMQIRHAEELAKEGGLANVDFSPQKEPLVMKKDSLEGKVPGHDQFVVSETGELVKKDSTSSTASELREYIIMENGEIVEGGKEDDFAGSPGTDNGQVLVVVPQESVETKMGGTSYSAAHKVIKTPKVFTCQYCDKTFSTSSHLKRHTYNHTGDKPHGCTECGKRFARMDKLRIHYRIHSGERPYSCQLCKKTFARSDLLSRHMYLHPEAIAFSIKGELDEDGKDQDFAVKYEEMVEGSQDQGEDGDDGRFLPLSSIAKREAKEKRLHPCPQCGKVFPRPSRLAAHLRLHSGEKPYECKECGKKFTRANHLNVHHRIHTGERPHVCQVCNRGFNRSHHLQRHMLIHTGEKPFPCQYCEKRYSRAAHLKDHMLNHHKEIMMAIEGPAGLQGTPFISRLAESQPSMVSSKDGVDGLAGVDGKADGNIGQSQGESGIVEGNNTKNGPGHEGSSEGQEGAQVDDKSKQRRDIKLYPCKHCDMVFNRQSHFERHVLMHDGKKPYECEECGKGFAGKDRLRVHKRIHTGERPYVCTICSKSFGRSHHLKRHLISHSGVKPFQCEFCDKRYSASYHLKDHMNNHHVLEMALKQEQQTGKSETLSFVLVNNDHGVNHCSFDRDDLDEEDLDRNDERDVIGREPVASQSEGDCAGFNKQQVFPGVGEDHGSADEDEEETKENKKQEKQKLSKTHQCPHCDRVFDRPSRLQSHMYAHTGEKPHTCDECGKSFGGLDRLRVHRRIHTGLKPHVCKICNKAFGRAYHLSRHMMSHTGSKLYQCQFCDRKFSTSSYLKQHQKSTHSLEPDYTSDPENTSDGQESDMDEGPEYGEALDQDPGQSHVHQEQGPADDNPPEHRDSIAEFYDSMNLNEHFLFLVGQEAVKNQAQSTVSEKSATLTPLNDPSSVPNKVSQNKEQLNTDVKEEPPVASLDQEVKKESNECEPIADELSLKDSYICNICGVSCADAGSFFYHREQHR